jgi:hypothetical protein
MSIGKNFLARVLSEGKKEDTKGFTFDRSVEAMKRSMRDIGGSNNYADKIAELFSMFGIPGMYLNKPAVRESVVEGAMNLKSKPARVRAFLALHSALYNFYGITPSKIDEAKSEEDELEGTPLQQSVEEILVSLGLPAEMVEHDAKAGIKSGLKRTISKVRADDAVFMAIRNFAKLAGIKFHDGVIGDKKAKVQEAVAVGSMGTDPNHVDAGLKGFMDSAKKICVAFGVPEMILTKPTVVAMMKKSATHDSASGVSRRLMDKLLTELEKRD